jgi:hypothetical protein
MTTIPTPAELLELTQNASCPVGKEAVCVNEYLRSLRALIEARPPTPPFRVVR